MSIQRFGPKKIRKFRTITGIDWEMIWNCQGTAPYDARTIENGKCRHAGIDRKTHEVEWDADPTHMSTCPGRGWSK